MKSTIRTAYASAATSLTPASPEARLVFINGPVITMDASDRIAQAAVSSGGKIIFVGNKDTALELAGPAAEIVDLDGAPLLPGFIDGHGHFPMGAQYELFKVNLNNPPIGSVRSIADIVSLLRGKLTGVGPSDWLQGFNYNDLALAERRHPTRVDLDQVSLDVPIFIKHVSGHLGVSNSKGLALAGIRRSSTDPQGGRIRKDTSGEPDGVLEGIPAQALLERLIPAATTEQYMAAIERDSRTYAAAGITTAQNGGLPSIDELFFKALERGALKVRVVIWPPAWNPELLKRYAVTASGTDLSTIEMITLGAAKLFADGSPQGYTAYFSKPYHVVPTGKPEDYRGFPVYSREELIRRVVDLRGAGWQVAIHGNGDQAIDDILAAYAEAQRASPRRDARDIIVHAQFARPDHLLKMAELRVVPSFFVTHTYFWGDIHREKTAGPERAAFISPTRAASDLGIRFSLHNDTPVTPISPLMDVYSAVNRITLSGQVLGPDQRIPVLRALRGVTIDAAYQHFQETSRGSIEPGKFADFVVLSRDPLTVAPERIKDLRVLRTYVGGREIYRAEL